MSASAPEGPGRDGPHEGPKAEGPARPALVRRLPVPVATTTRADGDTEAAGGRAGSIAAGSAGVGERPALRTVPDGAPRRLRPVPDPATAPGRPQQPAPGRRNRFVVAPDPAEHALRAARRRARANLPSPAAVTRDIALALLEVEAGCRSAAQLERIFSPELWEALEHRIGRRGGPLPSGRSLISVRCQEDIPGLADTVAVVQKGDVVRPVALRLDAGGGRWTVTELRWWRNETDTATTPSRDDGAS
jgi:hypothetical protein